MSDFSPGSSLRCPIHGDFSIDDSPGGCPLCPDEPDLGFPWDMEVGDEIIWDNPSGVEQKIIMDDIDFQGTLGDDECVIIIWDKEDNVIRTYAKELFEP